MVWLRTIVTALVIALATQSTAYGDYISSIVTVDTADHFTLVGTGSATTKTATYQFANNFITQSGYWFISGLIVETFGTHNDTLDISGTIQHLLSPPGHGDGAGPPIPFSLAVNADNAIGNPLAVTASDAKSPQHGNLSHQDIFTGTLRATVSHEAFSFNDSITSYQFTLDVSHTIVPEPSSLTLLGLGAIAMLGYARKKVLKSNWSADAA